MFSIIMPYYKNEHVVRRSIESVLSQAIMDYELIIVDDGSNDSLDSIVSSYNDDRIRVIHQDNNGVSSARNVGIKNSNGEWICFLDSDDEWYNNHLLVLTNLINKYRNKEMYITSHRRLGFKMVDSSFLIPDSWDNDFIIGNLLDLVFSKGEVIHTNSVCIKKEMFEKYGFFIESVSIGEDTDLWYRFSMYTTPVMSKEVTTVYHRDASYLTAHSKYSANWPFCKRQELLQDQMIPEDIKESMRLIVQRYILTTCKHLISSGDYNEAKCLYDSIADNIYSKNNKQKKQIRLLLLFPPFVARILAFCIYKIKQLKY